MDVSCKYIYFIVAAIGVCMGVLLNYIALHIVYGDKSSNECGLCSKYGIKLWFNYIITSQIFNKGECQSVNNHVDTRCIVSTLVCVVGFTSIYDVYGYGLETVEFWVYFSCLFLASLVDLASFIIPNSCVLVAIINRLLYLVGLCFKYPSRATKLFNTGIVSLMGVSILIITVSLIMNKVLHKSSIGGGDIKLLAVSALYFGWQSTLFLIIIACVFGVIHGVWYMNRKVDNVSDLPKGVFPWGPSIALASWIVSLIGEDTLMQYISLLGY